MVTPQGRNTLIQVKVMHSHLHIEVKVLALIYCCITCISLNLHSSN